MSSKCLLNWFAVSCLLALGIFFRNNFFVISFSINIKRKHLSSKFLFYTLYKDKTTGELEATMFCGGKVSHSHEIKLDQFLYKFIIIFASSTSKLMTQYLFIKGVHYHIIPGSHERWLIPTYIYFLQLSNKITHSFHVQVCIVILPMILPVSHLITLHSFVMRSQWFLLNF